MKKDAAGKIERMALWAAFQDSFRKNSGRMASFSAGESWTPAGKRLPLAKLTLR